MDWAPAITEANGNTKNEADGGNTLICYGAVSRALRFEPAPADHLPIYLAV